MQLVLRISSASILILLASFAVPPKSPFSSSPSSLAAIAVASLFPHDLIILI